jgi:membrane-bound serine protease (ClpP class)
LILNRRLLVLVAFLVLLGSSVFTCASAQQGFVYAVEVKGDINAGIADFIEKSIDQAERDNVALIIKLDTPGGLLSATEQIVKRMQRSKVPIAVWVTPRGAWAYSAGTFVLLASTENAAVMDNGTVIGAAQPRPEDPKVTAAMAEWIAEIARGRGRPPEIARKFVEQNLTMGPENALQENVIDLIASDIDGVLAHLGLSGAEVREIEMGWVSKFLSIISNPQIVIILFILGLFGLIAEVSTPGVGLPGVAGVICLLLAFWGMGVLEINYAGVALMGLGIVLLAYELLTPGFGVFGIGGIAALVLGLMMVDKEPWIEVAGAVVKGIITGVVAILAVILLLVRRTMKKPVAVGKEEMIGKVGVVTTDLAPEGLVKLKGELWTAVCEGHAKKGEEVIVRSVDGVKLIVEKCREEG